MFYKNQIAIRDYEDIARLFATCRDPKKGKPLSKWGRIHREGNDYFISCHGLRFAKISPDDTFEFLVTPQEGAAISVTLSGSMHYCLPLIWFRVGVCRYRVVHEIEYKNTRQKYQNLRHQFWPTIRKESPELFKGIKFCLKTGNCLNRRPDLLSTINPDMRKVWLRKIKSFKRAMRLRVKMGVFDSVYSTLLKDPANFTTKRPDWSSDQWIDELHKAIDTEQFPTELIRLFVIESVPRWRVRQSTAEEYISAVDSILNRNSTALRSKFGVFNSVIQGEAA
jgi:hypothetical protein